MIFNNYFAELSDYNDKFTKLKRKLERAKNKDIYLGYAKIRIKMHNLIKKLDLSQVMFDYKTHLAHLSFCSNTHEVSIFIANLNPIYCSKEFRKIK